MKRQDHVLRTFENHSLHGRVSVLCLVLGYINSDAETAGLSWVLLQGFEQKFCEVWTLFNPKKPGEQVSWGQWGATCNPRGKWRWGESGLVWEFQLVIGLHPHHVESLDGPLLTCQFPLLFPFLHLWVSTILTSWKWHIPFECPGCFKGSLEEKGVCIYMKWNSPNSYGKNMKIKHASVFAPHRYFFSFFNADVSETRQFTGMAGAITKKILERWQLGRSPTLETLRWSPVECFREGTWQPGATLVVWFQLDLIWICSSNHDGSYTKISV